jgi:hypothetical protein
MVCVPSGQRERRDSAFPSIRNPQSLILEKQWSNILALMSNIEFSPELDRTLRSIAAALKVTPEDVVWQLLRQSQTTVSVPISALADVTRTHEPTSVATPEDDSKDYGLSSRGGTLPDGLPMRLNYRGKFFQTQVKDSSIWVKDKAFRSPSAAAHAAAAALGFPNKSLNGWHYWEYEDHGKWRPLGDLRNKQQVESRSR